LRSMWDTNSRSGKLVIRWAASKAFTIETIQHNPGSE